MDLCIYQKQTDIAQDQGSELINRLVTQSETASTNPPETDNKAVTTNKSTSRPRGTKSAKDRKPKLTMISADGDVVECSFETYKLQTITFKFGLSDDDTPEDIARNMVSNIF